MKATDRIDQQHTAAEALVTFIAKMDMLTDEQSAELAEWIKAQEPNCVTNAEKHFLLAARAFVLDYPVELNDNAR